MTDFPQANFLKDTVTLTVDVGNSHTVIGVFREDQIVEHWRLTTRHSTTSDEVLIRISGLMTRGSSVAPEEVTHVGLSSVVPVLERPWVKALAFFLNRPVQVVSHTNCLNLPIDYASPPQLGSDRICNVLALRERGLEDGIVVDLGTATTFEIMKSGRFKGGLILPGISSGLEILTEKAARLMPVSLHWTGKLIADNTDDAIRAGLMYGFLGQLNFMIDGLVEEGGLKGASLIATGGWSTMISEKISIVDEFDPYLTLKGIRAVAILGNGAQE